MDWQKGKIQACDYSNYKKCKDRICSVCEIVWVKPQEVMFSCCSGCSTYMTNAHNASFLLFLLFTMSTAEEITSSDKSICEVWQCLVLSMCAAAASHCRNFKTHGYQNNSVISPGPKNVSQTDTMWINKACLLSLYHPFRISFTLDNVWKNSYICTVENTF